MFKLKLQHLLLIPLILLFFPVWGIIVGGKFVIFYYVFVTAGILLAGLFAPKDCIKKLGFLIKKTPMKYYLYFAIWVILSGIFNVMFGGYKIKILIYYIFSLLLIDYLFTYILPFFMYSRKKYNILFFIKFLEIGYFVIFIIGFVEFIAKMCGITAIIDFITIFSNLWIPNENDIGQMNRVSSLFSEPGKFGGFIFINMPMIFQLSKTKYKIFKNNLVNMIIKKSMIPLMYFNLFVAQSAIWLVFCLILTLVLIKDRIIELIKKYKYIVIFCIVLLTVILSYMIFILSKNVEQLGFYARIFYFVQNINSAEAMALAIPNLMTRIFSYVATLHVWKDHILFGSGIGSLAQVIVPYFEKMNTLTPELIVNLRDYNLGITKSMKYSGVTFYQYLAEIGIIGLFLYSLFVFKSFKYISKIKNYYCGLYKDFALGLQHTIITIACSIFYDINYTYVYLWFIFGLVNIFIIDYYKNKKENLSNDNN